MPRSGSWKRRGAPKGKPFGGDVAVGDKGRSAVALFLLQTPDYDAEGTKALDDGKYEAAAASFSKAIAADPQDYYAHFNLAMAYTFLAAKLNFESSDMSQDCSPAKYRSPV